MTLPFNVLILCTGNSARSILAEALINHWGQGKFIGYSAGSKPKGAVHPMSLKILEQMNLPSSGYRSKSWDEFSGPDAPVMDFIFTVCGDAADEECPIWSGSPVTAHWGVPDPAAMEGTEALKLQAFREAFRQLENRIKVFVSLPIDSLSTLKLKAAVTEIGQMSL
jgi:arsenate reductase (thioredoxin)